MAEAVRFELTNGRPSPVFKTGAFNHSATPPEHASIPEPWPASRHLVSFATMLAITVPGQPKQYPA